MELEKSSRRTDRLELASRAMLGMALVTGVVWALFEGGLPFGL